MHTKVHKWSQSLLDMAKQFKKEDAAPWRAALVARDMRKFFPKKVANGKGRHGWTIFYKEILRKAASTMTDYKNALEYVDKYVPGWEKDIEALPPLTHVARLCALMSVHNDKTVEIKRLALHDMLFHSICDTSEDWLDELSKAKEEIKAKTSSTSLQSLMAILPTQDPVLPKAYSKITVNITPDMRAYLDKRSARIISVSEAIGQCICECMASKFNHAGYVKKQVAQDEAVHGGPAHG